MKALLAALFGNIAPKPFTAFGPSKRTVEGALVHFNRAIDELSAVEEQENKEAARQEQALTEAAAALESARREATRARNKRAKIEAFIGDDEEVVEGVQGLRNVL